MTHTAKAANWKEWFQAPQLKFYSIAKNNPSVGLVASTESGTVQWYTWDPTNPQAKKVQITDTPGGHATPLFLSADGRFAYTLQDYKGNEIGHFVRMSVEHADTPAEDISPELPPFSAFGINASSGTGKIGFVAVYDNAFHLITLDEMANGSLSEPTELVTSKATLMNVQFSADGETVFVMTNQRSKSIATSLHAYDAATGEFIAELWDGDGTSIAGLNPSPVKGDGRILCTTNRAGPETCLLWNPHTGEREDLIFEDITSPLIPSDWGYSGQKILLACMDQAAEKSYVYNLETKQLTQLSIEPGTYSMSKFDRESSDIISLWQNATRPGTVVKLDGETGKLKQALLSAGEIPPGRSWRSITFQSANGQTIQGWLGLPEGEGPFPTILETHGGPTAVKTNTFSAESQTWMAHGFAFLSINYQGSTTFGREFQDSIYGNLGELEVQDMVAARQWLIDQGIAQPDKIIPFGGSYGGYLTLMALGTEPDLWAGGIAFVAIADWSIQYEDTAETLRAYQVSLFRGTPDEKPEQYAKSSPITYAEQVTAPVMIMQGKNDTRTPARPIAIYEEKLKSLGKHVELHWFETGHAGSRADISKAVEYMELQLDFVERILKD